MNNHLSSPGLQEWLQNSHLHYLVKIDLQGKYLYINQGFKDRFSFLKPEFIGTDFREAVYAADLEICEKALEECRNTPEQLVAVKIRKPIPNGGLLWTQWSIKLLTDGVGKATGFWCLGHDITEHEKDKEQALIAHQQTEQILESITDGFLILSHDFHVIRSNVTLQQWLGKNQEDIASQAVEQVFNLEPEHPFMRVLMQVLDTENSRHFSFYHQDSNRELDVSVYYSTSVITMYLRDQTAEIAVQRKIRSSEVILRALYNSSQDVALVLDRDLKVLFFNNEADQNAILILGHHLEEGMLVTDIIKKTVWQAILPSLRRALRGKAGAMEMQGQYLHGAPVWFSVKFFPVVHVDGSILGVAISAVNITEKKQYQLKIDEQNQQLRNIAFTQSHEIRAPLASILGLIHLMESEGQMSPYQQEIVNYLKACASQLDGVIHKVVGTTHELEGKENLSE